MMMQRTRREYDLHAWAMARIGIRNLDGGRGYATGVRVVSCPLCDDAELDRGRGWINVVRRYCGCMNAGCPVEDGVPATEYVRRVEGYRTRTEALGMLLRDYPDFNVSVVQPTRLAVYDDWCELPPSMLIVERSGRAPSLLYDESRAFIKSQWGLTARDAERWGLRYCVQGRYAFRIIIPIRMGGQIVGFQARTFRHAEPKYLTSLYGVRGEHHAECGRPTESFLFGVDCVTHGSTVLLVEGVGDVMSFAKLQDGIVPVGCLGVALTPEKAAILAGKQPGKVIVAFDADATGTTEKVATVLMMTWGLDVTTGRWVGGKDAGAGARLQITADETRGLSSLVAARFRR